MSAREIPDEQLDVLNRDELREELLRVRNQLRWHRDLNDNDRCWHADRELYARTLPENEEPGRMTSQKAELRHNCDVYIDQQQCELRGCTGKHLQKPEKPTYVICQNCAGQVPFLADTISGYCIVCGQTIDRTGAVIPIAM